MAACIAAGALFHVSIGPVPVTFQVLFVALAGLVLGPRYGVYAVALYIFAGAVGLPVFSGGRAGLGHLVGPTGGYLAGYLLLVFFSGLGSRLWIHNMPEGAEDKSDRSDTDDAGNRENCLSVKRLFPVAAMALIGLICLYVCGTSWFMHAMDFSFTKAFMVGVAPFILPDTFKILMAVLVWRTLYGRGYLPAEGRVFGSGAGAGAASK
ncbi:biotin transporter BioY [Desulfovibrio sp. OttesenSCG-928-G15]|nr:biotin transporter BioY [Desulfovibrio sp. OttesenSCG-928-G15]